MPKLTPIPQGEQATLRFLITDKLLTTTFTVKENKASPVRYNLTWLFDLTDVTLHEILGYALRSLRIDGQTMWRAAKDRMDGNVWQDKKWSVRAMLDSTRSKADPNTTAEKAIDKLSEAERITLFAKYA